MNPELRNAILELVRFALMDVENPADIQHSARIVSAYVEHGPLPSPDSPDYIAFKNPAPETGIVWKPKKRP